MPANELVALPRNGLQVDRFILEVGPRPGIGWIQGTGSVGVHDQPVATDHSLRRIGLQLHHPVAAQAEGVPQLGPPDAVAAREDVPSITQVSPSVSARPASIIFGNIGFQLGFHRIKAIEFNGAKHSRVEPVCIDVNEEGLEPWILHEFHIQGVGAVVTDSIHDLFQHVMFRRAIVIEALVHIILRPAPFPFCRPWSPFRLVLIRPGPFARVTAMHDVFREIRHINTSGDVVVCGVIRKRVRVDECHGFVPVYGISLVHYRPGSF